MKRTPIIAALFGLLCSPLAAWTAPLPVVNPSFEQLSRPLAVGEQTNGAGGVGVPVATRFPFGGGGVNWDDPVEVAGWRTRLRPPGDPATVPVGVLNPPLLGGEPFVTGQDGQYVCAVQAAQIGQTIDALLQPATRYRVSFLGGIGRFDTNYILSVSLIAVADVQGLPLEGEPGVTRLAITQGLVVPPQSFGTMLPYSMEYTTPETLPPALEGTRIGIHMYGSDGFPRVLYDHFALDATAIPEPAGAWLLLAALTPLVGGRR